MKQKDIYAKLETITGKDDTRENQLNAIAEWIVKTFVPKSKESTLLPGDFTVRPFESIWDNHKCNKVAGNIMVILKDTGNTWRVLPFEEYDAERLKEGDYHYNERAFFDRVKDYCVSPEAASTACKAWKEIYLGTFKEDE